MIPYKSPCHHFLIDTDETPPAPPTDALPSFVQVPHVPSIRHGLTLALIDPTNPDSLNSDLAGWHLTPDGNPNEKGCLVRYPRYIYWLPNDAWDGDANHTNSANSLRMAYGAAAEKSLRCILARNFYQGAPSFEVLGFPALELVAYIPGVDLNDYQGGQLYIASYWTSFTTAVGRHQEDSWGDSDPTPEINTDPPEGFDTLYEQKTFQRPVMQPAQGENPPFAGQQRGVTQIWISNARINATVLIQQAIAARYNKFRQAFWYASEPFTYYGVSSFDDYPEVSLPMDTTTSVLYPILAPPPHYYHEVVSGVAHGPAIIAKAMDFFTT